MTTQPRKPVVFACAGSSPAGNLSWLVAKELERQDAAEMSCLAGIGARKAAFMRKLRDREVWVIDGCPVDCGADIFALIDRPPDYHIRLADFGITKRQPHDGQTDVMRLTERILVHLQNRPDESAGPMAETHGDNVSTYEYKCRTCAHRFEVVTTFLDQQAAPRDELAGPNDYREQQPACPACESHEVDHVHVYPVTDDVTLLRDKKARRDDE